MPRQFCLYLIFLMHGIFGIGLVHAQAPGFLFRKTFGGNNHDNVFATKQTIDGGFVLGGVTNSKDGDVKGFHGGNSDILVLKLNASGSMQWLKCYGGGNIETGTVVHELTAIKNGQLQNDGYIIGATTSSGNGDVKGYKGGSSDMWIVRINSAGAVVWQRTIGGSGTDELISLKPSPDGGFIVSGKTMSNNGDAVGQHGGTDILVVKLSSAGIPVWGKTLGNTGSEIPFDLQVLSDGRAVILSRISQAIPGGDITSYWGEVDFWISCLSSSGNLLWQKTLGGSEIENGFCLLRTTADGHLLLCGTTYSNDGDLAGVKSLNGLGYWVVKLNHVNGAIIWNWADNTGPGNLFGMNHTNDGGFILVGSGSDGDASTHDGGKLVKISSSGTMLWSRDYGYPTGSGELYAVQETSNGDFLALGGTMFMETPGVHILNDTTVLPDLWVIRVNSAGVKIWDKAYGGKNEDWYGTRIPSMLDIHGPLTINNYWDDFLDANGNIYTALNASSMDGDVTGLHAKFGARSDIWFIRLNTGTPVIQAKEIISPVTRVSAYPNPFRHSTVISFQPPGEGPATIKIFNTQGSLIEERRLTNIQAGRVNTIRLDLKNHSQGLYYYTITQGNYSGTGKLILQR